MSKKEGKIKTKKSDSPAEFISPLEKYVTEKCFKCRCWKDNTCNTREPNGIDRMFLCMCAANVNTVIADPEQILKTQRKPLEHLTPTARLKIFFQHCLAQRTPFIAKP